MRDQTIPHEEKVRAVITDQITKSGDQTYDPLFAIVNINTLIAPILEQPQGNSVEVAGEAGVYFHQLHANFALFSAVGSVSIINDVDADPGASPYFRPLALLEAVGQELPGWSINAFGNPFGPFRIVIDSHTYVAFQDSGNGICVYDTPDFSNFTTVSGVFKADDQIDFNLSAMLTT